MRTITIISTLLMSAAVGLPQDRSFTGEIMDSPCANMHSHARMMQGMNAKDAVECTRKCVGQMGGKYALFETATQKAYQLDNQEQAASFAGKKVSVKGILDASGKTIHVESIGAQ